MIRNDKNINNKSTLAKLLATENIEIQENAVKTASFDVVNRILTLPIFKEENKSKHVYDMLVGHEVSHALHTPAESWKDMGNRSDEFRSFVNVIEDVRIDKLIQKKYPGLTEDYLKGFEKMYKDNFFGTDGKDISTYGLIDKINLYYKSSKTLNFNFNAKENIFVKLVDNCKTFEDVIKLTEEILGYCKEEAKNNPELKKTYIVSKDKSDGSKLKSEGEGEDGDNKKSDKSVEEKLEEFISEKIKKAEQNKNDNTEQNENDNKEDKTISSGLNGSDGEFKLRSLTEEAMDNALDKMKDESAKKRSYRVMPKVSLDKLIRSNKEYIKDFAVHDSSMTDNEKIELNKCADKTMQFLKDSSPVVNYLVKEFEMKKNAKMHARVLQSKTGVIDPQKLYSYKFSEDIFKKITSLPNQKNHGMIFLLDWSASMSSHILPVVEQLLNLAMFCRKINIPFSVYKFLNNKNGANRRWDPGYKENVKVNKPFIYSSKSLCADQDTQLVQLFSHRQSKLDFYRSAKILHRSALYFSSRYGYGYRENYRVPSISREYYLSSTPLNDSLIAMDTIIKKFKLDYKTDKLSLVTLTDGSSDYMNNSGDGDLHLKLGQSYVDCSGWRGHGAKTSLTNRLLKYLKKKHNLQTIGFYIVKKFQVLRHSLSLSYEKQELARKMFLKQKFFPDYNTGYDVYFYCKSDTKVVNDLYEAKDTTNKSQLKRMFMSGMKKRLESRVLLQNFIKRVA